MSTAHRDREFSSFVEVNGASLRRYCVLLTGSQAQADDLLQDSLLKVYLALHRITDPEALGAYTRQTITRTHISWWRSIGRREFATDNLGPAGSTRDDQRIADQDQMWRLLATLAPRQRAVVVLRFYEDLAEADIAEHLDCSVGTVKSQLSRALATLRKRLALDDPPHSPSQSPLATEGQLR